MALALIAFRAYLQARSGRQYCNPYPPGDDAAAYDYGFAIGVDVRSPQMFTL